MIWLIVLTVLTLNVNGLSCQEKWAKVWSEVLCTDIIYFQETHLQSTNEFVFPLGAQGYDFFYSHGTTSSAAVCTAIRRCLSVNPVKSVDDSGCILGVDLTFEQTKFQVLNIYAPNNSMA